MKLLNKGEFTTVQLPPVTSCTQDESFPGTCRLNNFFFRFRHKNAQFVPYVEFKSRIGDSGSRSF